MTHLYIEQNNNIEVVTSLILKKLYDVASSNSIETCVLKGNLQAPHCYDYIYEYLTGNVSGSTKRFPDLSLNITDGVYITFVDPVIADYWINSSYGDGEGITLASAASVTSFPKRETATNTSSELFDTYSSETNTQLNHGNYAFYKDTTVTSFNELGRFTNITEIRTSMFRDSSLQHIDLSNITAIYASAFSGANLTGIVNLPKLTTWGARLCNTKRNMDNLYFADNSNMTEIHIGSLVPDESKITSILHYTFLNCSSLNNITGLSKITRIETQAFKGCTSLENLEDLNTDSSIYIGENAFENCTNLKCIDITKADLNKSNIFANCSSLVALDTNDLDHINDNIEYTLETSSLGSGAFQNTGLTGKTIIIPNITSIGASSFKNTKISKFVGTNVTSVESLTFYNCTQLQEVDLGNVTTIGDHPNGVFLKCSNLTTIKFGNLTNDFTNLQYIGRNAFYECSILFPTNLSLPNATYIGLDAFRGHTEILSITNLGSITSLQDSLFWDCSNLSSVTLPNTLTSFSLEALGKTALTYILVPEGVTDAGFGQCVFSSGLFRYAELPSTVTTMTLGFHRCFESSGDSGLNTVMCVIKATTPPTVTYYLNLVEASLNGVRRLRGIYVPDSALSTYQSASGFWSYSDVQAILKPISQLETDSPTYWAVYQSGLSNS